jgi:hypothetical protein
VLRFLIEEGHVAPRRQSYEAPNRREPPSSKRTSDAKPKSTNRWEIVAPATLCNKPSKRIEEACAAYGLELKPTAELPKLPEGYPRWKIFRGKLFTTSCPQCRGVMHVSTHYQRWTCQCDRKFPYRKEHAPDVVGLVEQLTECGYLNAVWWVIGTGHQPSRLGVA